MSEFVTRFAPSPTGHLHLGHAYSALTAFDAARRAGGRFLLRIEDIDTVRCKPGYEAAIFKDLAWLGLEWETPVRRQSDHFDDYERALGALRDKNIVYRCFRTRKEIAEVIASAPHLGASGPEGPQFTGAPLAPGEEADLLAEGAPFAWRLSMQAARDFLGAAFDRLSFFEEGDCDRRETGATPAIFGDPVVARKDVGTSYHLACIHDDAAQGVTHVIRGQDLYASTHLHVLLQRLLGLPTPVYRHHRLLTDEKGARLAKRDKSKTLSALRADGKTPQDIRAETGLIL